MIKYSPLMIRLVLLLGLNCIGPIALAEEPKKPAATAKQPPDKLSQLDAAKLDAALTHIEFVKERAQRLVNEAQAEINKHEEEVQRICKEYGLDRAKLGEQVDTKTGAITRKSASPKK